MADIVRFIEELGTPIVWGESGASGVTNALGLNNLAAAAGRVGVAADLGAQWDCDLLVQAAIESGTAPTAGGAVEVFLIFSRSSASSGWPAGIGDVSASDAAFTVANSAQLGLPAAQVVAINASNTLQTQAGLRIKAKARYMTVVVINRWDQAIRNEGTATNNDSRVTVTPILYVGIDP